MKAHLSEEQIQALFEQAMDAEEAGDIEKSKLILNQIPISAGLAMELKRAVGGEIMKNLDLNYSEVEEKYGPDWYR